MRNGSELWRGVLVASTTPFDAKLSVDRPAFVAHSRRLAEAGVDAIVTAGSVGEGAALSVDEKVGLVAALAGGSSLPVVAAIGSTRAAESIDLARSCARAGASGLLLLPPYVYQGDARETSAYFGELLGATELPCMLYNNPSAYGTDVRPAQIVDLCADHPTLRAVKESSGDVRRITELRALLGDRIEIAVGLDDAVLEGAGAGARGWVAGLANAFPEESVALWNLARTGQFEAASELYRWFLPLLRWDTRPKFVQLIKLAEAGVLHGAEWVRSPRFPLVGEERAAALATLESALATRPGRARGRRSRAPAHRR
jgi:1-pyrroline-4-hydroxy-2-carboxylate deaminase